MRMGMRRWRRSRSCNGRCGWEGGLRGMESCGLSCFCMLVLMGRVSGRSLDFDLLLALWADRTLCMIVWIPLVMKAVSEQLNGGTVFTTCYNRWHRRWNIAFLNVSCA